MKFIKPNRGSASVGPEELQQYLNEVRRYIKRHLRPGEDADDIVQEAYLKYQPYADSARDPRSYLFRVAFNVLTEQRRRAGNQQEQCYSDLTEECSAGPNDPCEEIELQQRRQKVLATIPMTYRPVFLMKMEGRLSAKQIAAKLGIAPDSVPKYLQRAMKFARRANTDGDEEGASDVSEQ